MRTLFQAANGLSAGPRVARPVRRPQRRGGIEGVDVDALEPEPLHARFLARHQLDVGHLDSEELCEQLAHRHIGSIVDRWRRDPNLHRVAVTTDDRGATRARLHVHAEHDCIALDGVAVVPMHHFGPQRRGGCP